jgi:ER-Golgi trafficking TRAPP I complex 85 kDa subunit
MERRMSALRAAVAQHRGTFLRSLSKAIGFPSRSPSLSQNGRTYGPDDGLYSFESPESRLRQLADMYFMVGQYRDAEACYADVAEEFRARRSTPHHAAALEALALARYMQMATGGATGLEVWKCARRRHISARGACGHSPLQPRSARSDHPDAVNYRIECSLHLRWSRLTWLRMQAVRGGVPCFQHDRAKRHVRAAAGLDAARRALRRRVRQHDGCAGQLRRRSSVPRAHRNVL